MKNTYTHLPLQSKEQPKQKICPYCGCEYEEDYCPNCDQMIES